MLSGLFVGVSPAFDHTNASLCAIPIVIKVSD